MIYMTSDNVIENELHVIYFQFMLWQLTEEEGCGSVERDTPIQVSLWRRVITSSPSKVYKWT